VLGTSTATTGTEDDIVRFEFGQSGGDAFGQYQLVSSLNEKLSIQESCFGALATAF
jgi:hypothetical protein